MRTSRPYKYPLNTRKNTPIPPRSSPVVTKNTLYIRRNQKDPFQGETPLGKLKFTTTGIKTFLFNFEMTLILKGKVDLEGKIFFILKISEIYFYIKKICNKKYISLQKCF